jgi:gamma-glutamyltranspeptidase/glutathione hydrolase/leukotriene-C4 hydrolase
MDGILSHVDLENYTVSIDRALEGTYRDRKVYTSHAPASGPGAYIIHASKFES